MASVLALLLGSGQSWLCLARCIDTTLETGGHLPVTLLGRLRSLMHT